MAPGSRQKDLSSGVEVPAWGVWARLYGRTPHSLRMSRPGWIPGLSRWQTKPATCSEGRVSSARPRVMLPESSSADTSKFARYSLDGRFSASMFCLVSAEVHVAPLSGVIAHRFRNAEKTGENLAIRHRAGGLWVLALRRRPSPRWVSSVVASMGFSCFKDGSKSILFRGYFL